MLASSHVGRPGVETPRDSTLSISGVTMSPIRIDNDLLPTTVFAIHYAAQPAGGWLVGEFSLEEMWRMVDCIRDSGDTASRWSSGQAAS